MLALKLCVNPYKTQYLRRTTQGGLGVLPRRTHRAQPLACGVVRRAPRRARSGLLICPAPLLFASSLLYSSACPCVASQKQIANPKSHKLVQKRVHRPRSCVIFILLSFVERIYKDVCQSDSESHSVTAKHLSTHAYRVRATRTLSLRGTCILARFMMEAAGTHAEGAGRCCSVGTRALASSELMLAHAGRRFTASA